MTDIESKKLKEEELKILDYFVKLCKDNDLKYYLAYGTLIGAVRHKGFIPWDDDIDLQMPPKDFLKLIDIIDDVLDKKYVFQYIENEKYIHIPFAKIRKKNTCMIEEDWAYVKSHKGINIDIFPLLPYPDDESDRKKMLFKFRIINLLVSKNNKTTSLKTKVVFTILKLIPRKITNKWAGKMMREILSYDKPYSMYKVAIHDPGYQVKSYEKTLSVPFEDKKYLIPKDYDDILTRRYGDYMTLPKEEDRVGHGAGKIILSFDKEYEDIIK